MFTKKDAVYLAVIAVLLSVSVFFILRRGGNGAAIEQLVEEGGRTVGEIGEAQHGARAGVERVQRGLGEIAGSVAGSQERTRSLDGRIVVSERFGGEVGSGIERGAALAAESGRTIDELKGILDELVKRSETAGSAGR
jgi:hypothetical protein